jgi:cytochrome c553
MKLITTLTLGLLTTLTLNAKTTMCFKENHISMTTIETTALDGGVCASHKNVQDMKSEGWSVDDIKIQTATKGNNYIYIFKKEEQNITSIDEEKLEQKILYRLEKRKKEEQEATKFKIYTKKSISGKKYYIKKCQKCHGLDGSQEYATARAINSLSLYEFKTTIKDYNLQQYDRGQGFVMYPFANNMDSNDIKNVYIYLESLKPENKDKKMISIKKEEAN